MLVLASSSKARSQLLKNAGISHKVIVSDIDEDHFEEKNVKRLVQLLSSAKTGCVASKILDRELEEEFYKEITAVIGCDSLFEFEGEIFGKPKNKDEALIRWQRMSSGSGYLHTGHCLLFRSFSSINDRNLEFTGISKNVITTRINFSKIDIEDIVSYIETGEPLECAGGFALEGRAGMFIRDIKGCYSNVVGLSLPWLKTELKKNDLLKC